MGAQVEGIFRVGIAPLPASALMVSFSPRASTSPSVAHFVPKYSMSPQILSLQELLPLCYGFHPSPKRGVIPLWESIQPRLFFIPIRFPSKLQAAEVPPFTDRCFFPKEALSSPKPGSFQPKLPFSLSMSTVLRRSLPPVDVRTLCKHILLTSP